MQYQAKELQFNPTQIVTSTKRKERSKIAPNACYWQPTLSPVPELFFIERTSFEVSLDLASIVSRIAQCLRLRSVQTEYDNDKAIAKCVTSSDTKFHINLFLAARNVNDMADSDSATMLVEVQKRSGNSMDFWNEYNALKKAIEQNVLPALQEEEGEEAKNQKKKKSDPEEQMRSILKDKYIPLSDGAIEGNVRMAQEYITSSSIEHIYHGLGELISLTNPDATSRNTSFKVAKMIMNGNNYPDISIIVARMISSDNRMGDRKMLYLALTLLANMLDALQFEKNATSSLPSAFHSENTILSLVDTLKNARNDPHMACLVAKCITYLFSYSDAGDVFSGEEKGIKREVVTCELENARKIGAESHYQLERETTNAIKIFSF